jgi:hypothetical protein
MVAARSRPGSSYGFLARATHHWAVPVPTSVIETFTLGLAPAACPRHYSLRRAVAFVVIADDPQSIARNVGSQS